MTRHELVHEYVSGRIDRRTFIQRLTALGMSVAAAGVYASTLAPSADAAPATGAPAEGAYRRRANFQEDDIEAAFYGGTERCRAIRARIAELNSRKTELTKEIAAEPNKTRRVRLRKVRQSINVRIALLRRKYGRECR